MRTLLALLLLAAGASADDAKKMNVIIVLADDLGYADLGCSGNTFHETPHLDRLAKDSLSFTTAYAACTVCSPTRASILTGQYPARLHITDWIPGYPQGNTKLKLPDWTQHLPTETYTIAKAFKAAGYATASIGKWHLGGPEFYPEKHGFDVNIAGTDKGQPPSYFSPFKIATLKDGPAGEFLTDALTREACNWIDVNKAKPFFLYLPHFAVHTPLMGKPAVVEKYKKKAEKLGLQRNATYAALVESVDDSVSTLRAKLKELKLDNNTIIIFTSDNGGLIGTAKKPVTTNPPLRAGKGSAYEGGVREPFMVFWPLIKKKDDQILLPDAAPVMSIDIFPTLADALKLPVPATHVFDGKSFYSSISMWFKSSGNFDSGYVNRDLYWHYPHYHPGGATPYSAIRSGDWRLIEFFEDGRLELYNLKNDVGESKNLAGSEPAKSKELHEKLKAWRTSVGAQLPTANPNYKP